MLAAMTLSALTRYISPKTKAEVFQVERGGDGHVTVYFFCTDPETQKIRNFAVTCDTADEIRVWPESFGTLCIETAPPLREGAKPLRTKKRALLRFGEMHIIGYGFQSIYIPVGG